jgi:hypothetical protein
MEIKQHYLFSSSNYVQYTNTGLTFSGHSGSGIGGAATITSSGAGDHNRTFTSQNSGTVYMSCLVNITAAAAGSDYFLHFNNSTFNARVAVQLSGTNIRFGISKAGTPVVAATNFNLSTTYKKDELYRKIEEHLKNKNN